MRQLVAIQALAHAGSITAAAERANIRVEASLRSDDYSVI